MSASRETPQSRLDEYRQRLRGLNSYIDALNARADEYDTDRAHFEHDLLEAEHNVSYYEAEIARLEGESGGAGAGGVLQGALPRTLNQGAGALLLVALGFAAGVLVGSRLLSERGDD